MMPLSIIIFRNTEGKILLQFRDSKAPSEPLGWSFFGGIAEGKESPIEAIIRETDEELDLKITPDQLRLLISRPWISSRTGKEKVVHLYEYISPIHWREIEIKEGAGAAFLSKQEITSLKNISLLAKTLIADHC